MAGKTEWETKSGSDIQCLFLRNAAFAALLFAQRGGLDGYTSACSVCRQASVTWKKRGGNPVFIVQGEENCTRTVIRR